MRATKLYSVFIGGTLAVPPIAHLYYKSSARTCGVTTRVVSIPGRGLLDINESQAEIAAQIDRYVPAGAPLILSGHSQGALHAVKYALDHPNVVRVVSWSGPHHGTHTARLFPLFSATRQMSPGSSFMREYEAHLPEIAPRLHSFYLRHDLLIVPFDSSHVDGAHNYLAASPEEYLVIGEHMRDTQRIDSRGNHITAVLSHSLHDAVRKVHVSDAATAPAA